MNEEELQQIEARLKAGEPREWVACDGFLGSWVDGLDGAMDVSKDDATFIANAPSDIAALLKEVRRLQDQLDDARSELSESAWR